MEEDLPIDIHYNKLLDWLVSRRHCQAEWQKSVLPVREKINGAVQDMPAVEEITALLQGTHINYFHCVRIVELLKKTEGAKNIFGQYSSQKLKDWLEIIRLYEKDGVYLAEVAQQLARNVNFEIPALKRQIARCVQSSEDCARKEVDYTRSSAELRDKFALSCKQMGIEGKKMKRELSALVRNMPATYNELANGTPSLLPAVQYYADFVTFLLGSGASGATSDSLPLLRHVIARGNTTVYEWKTGTPPAKLAPELQLDPSFSDEEEDKEKADEIDWGNLDDASGVEPMVAADINFESINGATEAAAEIDWTAVTDLGTEIEIEVVGDQTSADNSTEDDVVRGLDALSVLDNAVTRNQFLDELYELETFLTQRLEELGGGSGPSGGGGSNVLSDAVLASAPASILVDRSRVEQMLSGVSGLVGQLTAPRMQSLCLIRNSPRYVDRVVEGLKKISADAEKMLSLARLMVIRREEALVEKRDTEPKLELVRQKTKELQRQIEGEISAKYKNRRVNIMGEINAI